MATAYQSKPMSEILAPTAEVQEQAQTDDKPAATQDETKVVTPEVPEKYAGKSVGDVIEMHQNAESRLGQLQNEVGSLRGVVTELSQLKRTPAETETVQEPVSVSGDELIASPTEAITRVVTPLLEAQEAKSDAARIDALVITEGQALLANFPDVSATAASPEFKEFANRTPSRRVALEQAAGAEGLTQIRAARTLLEEYQDFQEATAPKETGETPVEIARKVATEGSGPSGPTSSKPQVFASEAIKLLNGSNEDVAKYRSDPYQKELREAIKEGRYVQDA